MHEWSCDDRIREGIENKLLCVIDTDIGRNNKAEALFKKIFKSMYMASIGIK